MPTRHELPGDHWVELKDPMDITERDRKPIRRAFQATVRQLRGPAPKRGQEVVGSPDPTAPPQEERSDGYSDEQLDALDNYQYTAMAFCVAGWDFPEEPSAESVQNLPSPVYTELDRLTAVLVQEVVHGIRPPEPAPEEEEDSNPSEP